MTRSIDALAVQVAQTNGVVKQTAQNVEKLTDRIDRLTDRIDRLASVVERQAQSIDGHLEIAKQQSTNITELTKLVATQANTVATLISRTA